ncbi:ABC transporter transmembrane domain-containing protein [Parenemella sanctibonifatiensis]|uniref:ABC transporter ATP-binding protein n=1 Tax=Parenemella sanctibonifatiensis TaxID=2016505 RepID=A0A255EAD0_9ACTN|nr:ABC transporter ATP-binding protein [Parenemella sanctibonifatiensis]OYN88528.1 hypothetical protein CGZ91_13005 [Parenemella sanctibonifatiensis]
MNTGRRQFLGRIYRRHRSLFALILLFQVAAGITRALGAALVEPLTNAILDKAVQVFVLFLVATLIIDALSYVTRCVAAILTTHLQGHALVELRLVTVRRILHMPMLAFETRGRGELVSLVQRDTQQAAERVYTVWSRILTCLTTGGFSIVAMTLLDPSLTAILVAATLVAALLNSTLLKRVKDAERDARKAQGGLTNTVLTAIAAFDVARIFNAVGFIRAIFGSHRDSFERAVMRSTHIDGQRVGLYSIVSTGTVFTAALWMAYRVAHGEANVGTLSAYIALMLQGLVSIETSFRWWSRLTVSDASWERLDEIGATSTPAMAIAGKLPAASDRHSGPVTQLDIASRFTYPGADTALRHQLHAGLGTVNHIPGNSGSGKTTLLKCLLGLYPFDPGSTITINNTPTTQHDLSQLSSYAPATGGLFDSSVRDNLTLGDPAITTKHIMEHAATLNLAEWLTTYGLDSNIGPGGSHLSGGQRQSLCVLRALLAPRDIVILDEPFSALDVSRAEGIAQGIAQASKTKLVLITSHRPIPTRPE